METPKKMVDFCKTREELAKKYFKEMASFYEKGNMGIVALLSDTQERMMMALGNEGEYWREILNDIKSVLVEEHRNQYHQ